LKILRFFQVFRPRHMGIPFAMTIVLPATKFGLSLLSLVPHRGTGGARGGQQKRNFMITGTCPFNARNGTEQGSFVVYKRAWTGSADKKSWEPGDEYGNKLAGYR
jgi:hypothetical protein